MKKLAVKKDAQCMACLQCVAACSEAFYKEFDEDLSCIKIVAAGTGAKPKTCIQCGKCMRTCEHEAITQNTTRPAWGFLRRISLTSLISASVCWFGWL